MGSAAYHNHDYRGLFPRQREKMARTKKQLTELFNQHPSESGKAPKVLNRVERGKEDISKVLAEKECSNPVGTKSKWGEEAMSDEKMKQEALARLKKSKEDVRKRYSSLHPQLNTSDTLTMHQVKELLDARLPEGVSLSKEMIEDREESRI